METKPTLTTIAKMDWVRSYKGDSSFLVGGYLGFEYTKIMREFLGACLDRLLIIQEAGSVEIYVRKSELIRFGNYLAERVIQDDQVAGTWCRELKKKSGELLDLINRFKGQKIGKGEFKYFLEIFTVWSSYYRAIKLFLDFLPVPLLEKLIKKFSEADQAATPVAEQVEVFMQSLALEMGQLLSLDQALVLNLLPDELDRALHEGERVPLKVLKDRQKLSAIYFYKGTPKVFLGREVETIRKVMEKLMLIAKVFCGTVAYPGKVTGRVRVLGGKNKNRLEEGEILVTSLTQDAYLSILKKSA
ncbi:MAG: hypothetical protein V1821_04400, partial [bacterium]